MRSFHPRKNFFNFRMMFLIFYKNVSNLSKRYFHLLKMVWTLQKLNYCKLMVVKKYEKLSIFFVTIKIEYCCGFYCLKSVRAWKSRHYSLLGTEVEKDESFCGRGIVPRRCKAIPALSPITMGQYRADNEQPLSLNPHARIAQPPRTSLQVIARITRGWWFYVPWSRKSVQISQSPITFIHSMKLINYFYIFFSL